MHNWTTEDVVRWSRHILLLPATYDDYFRRNHIDGQHMPRLALNDANYLTNVMQIKDTRHKRLIMLKATDLVLFGEQTRPHSVIKDALMATLLGLSLAACFYLFHKHRKSLEEVKLMMQEFNRITVSNDNTATNGTDLSKNTSTTTNDQLLLSQQALPSIGLGLSLGLFGGAKQRLATIGRSASRGDIFFEQQLQQRQNQEIIENNVTLTKELNIAKV